MRYPKSQSSNLFLLVDTGIRHAFREGRRLRGSNALPALPPLLPLSTLLLLHGNARLRHLVLPGQLLPRDEEGREHSEPGDTDVHDPQVVQT
jgi:hypothetical protein